MAALVFGYGSLMETQSRERTNPDAGDVRPARVTGFQRGWFHQFSDYVGSSCTYLGASGSATATVNGVIYHVDDFQKTKERETGYTAVELSPKAIEMLDGKAAPDQPVYLFVSNPTDISKTLAPTLAFPMVQSYVDICINGCLEIEAAYPNTAKNFAEEFIRTTIGWNAYWVNDRIYPRRPFIYRPNATTIDKVLNRHNLLQFVQLRDIG